MEISPYALVILGLMVVFFISSIYALYWSAQNGHFQDLEAGARSIFTPDEPEGQQTDFFPNSTPKVQSTPVKVKTSPWL